MVSFLKTFERRVVKPQLRRLKPWRHMTYGDIRVNYRDHLDGGGRTFGMDYLPLFHDLGVPRQRAYFRVVRGPGIHRLRSTWPRLLATHYVWPMSIPKQSKHVGLQSRKTAWQSESPSITLIIWTPFRNPSVGIWSSEIHRTSVDHSPGELRFHDERWSLHRRSSPDRSLPQAGRHDRAFGKQPWLNRRRHSAV